MEDRDHFPDFMEVVESITDAEIVSSGSQHSIVVKITLATGEVCALKIVFIYDGEKEENKDLRPKLLREDRGKTTTSPDEFYDECGTQTMIYERSLYAKITPELQGHKVLTREEAAALIDKLMTTTLPPNYSEYLRSWVQNVYKLAVIKMELLGPEFQPLDKIVLAENEGAEERLFPYLPKMFAIILFMEYKLNKLLLDPNLGNFMAIREDPSSVRVIDLAETISSNIHLTPSDITQNTVEYCINKINRNAFNFLSKIPNYRFRYGPYKPLIDAAFISGEKEQMKRQIVVELNKLTNANTTIYYDVPSEIGITDLATEPPTKKTSFSQQGPVYGGSKRARRKPRITTRRTTRRRATRRRTRRRRR